MKKHIIKDFDSLKHYFRTIERPFFAVHKYPYNAMIGIEHLIRNFEILSFLNTKEADVIAKKNKISFFMEGYVKGEFRKDEISSFNNSNNFKIKDENSKTIATLKDKIIAEYLKSKKEKPVLLLYRMSEGLVNLFKENKWTIVGSDYNVRKKYDNKIDFNRILEEVDLPVPPYMILPQEEIDYDVVAKSLGDKVVIQFPISFSGSGTFIVQSKEDFYKTISSDRFVKQKKKNTQKKIRITKYINRKLSPVMGVCCTKEGIVYTDLYNQIIDMPEVVNEDKGTGVYCGNEWTSVNFSETVKKQAYKAADKIGKYLKNKEGYKGYFGLDFILDDDTKILYPIEVNVRLIGSFPVFSMIQEVHKQPLIQALQILQYLDLDDYVLDIESINKNMKGKMKGSYINLYSRNKNAVYNKGELEAGIYCLGGDGDIRFSRKS